MVRCVSLIIPDLDRLLAACVVALQDEGLSWITANRVLKRRLDAHVSAGLLALMVALEAVVAPDHWQLRHRAGPRLREIISGLGKALSQTGTLSWASPAGEQLRQQLLSAQCSSASGWVNKHSISELMGAASKGSALQLPVEDDVDESASTFEELLREARDIEKTERTQQALLSIIAKKA